jgi:hypothetical protein
VIPSARSKRLRVALIPCSFLNFFLRGDSSGIDLNDLISLLTSQPAVSLPKDLNITGVIINVK